jgi:hypothetical protein
MAVVEFADQYYRAPANEGFDAVLDSVRDKLAAAGFGSHPRLELSVIESELTGPSLRSEDRVPAKAWTPRSARLILKQAGQPDRVLHAFSRPEEVDRVMLPINAPSGQVEARLAFQLDEVEPGKILVMEAPPLKRVIARAIQLGAAAIVSSSLYAFNHDPTGKERHLEAIQFRTVPVETEIPVLQISPRSFRSIREAADVEPSVRLFIEVDVELAEKKLRTLIASVIGSDRPHEAVAMMSHIQEPGACDNASGVASLLGSALSMAELLKAGRLEWPSRTLVFIWGDEMRMTETWLDSTKCRPVAGISSDMTGQSQEKTGAIALLERMPDPGALTPLAPDEHTPWGAREVEKGDLSPNGLAVIARCGLGDAGAVDGGAWKTAEHPWEGGSDHDVFIERGLPAVLFWHFTDFTYHTSLDRLHFVDVDELRRTAVALTATAMALCDPRPGDLDRYLRTLEKERVLRVRAARDAGEPELAAMWERWCDQARQWLRAECLRIAPPESRPGS